MRANIGMLLMRLLRAGEAVLSPGPLRWLLLPLVIPLAVSGLRLWPKMRLGWKRLEVAAPDRWCWLVESTRFHLVRFLNFWPDRFTLPRWRQRVQLEGLEPVKALHAAGRPTVLVCLHHGPIHVLRYLLRAGGLPCAMVVLESRAERSPVREWKDSLSPPPGVPNVFCRDELKEMKLFMKSGGCLLVAADYGRGKLCVAPFGRGGIQVATGAFRLANSVGATVFPVSVSETGGWCYRVEVGSGFKAGEAVETLAAEVLAELAPKVLATPEQMHSQLADSLVAGRA